MGAVNMNEAKEVQAMSDLNAALSPIALSSSALVRLGLLCGLIVLAEILHDVGSAGLGKVHLCWSRAGVVRDDLARNKDILTLSQKIKIIVTFACRKVYRSMKIVFVSCASFIEDEIQNGVAVIGKFIAWTCGLAEICQLCMKLLIVVIKRKQACLRLARADRRISQLTLEQVNLRAEYVGNLAVSNGIAEGLEPMGGFNGHTGDGYFMEPNVSDQATASARRCLHDR